MGFSRQEYGSGLPFPSLGDPLDPGIKPRSVALQVDSLPSVIPGKTAIQTMPPSEAVTASTGVTTQLYRWVCALFTQRTMMKFEVWETKHIILEALGNYHTDKTSHSKKSFFQKLLKLINGPLVNLGQTICISYIIQETNGDGIDTPQFSNTLHCLWDLIFSRQKSISPSSADKGRASDGNSPVLLQEHRLLRDFG